MRKIVIILAVAMCLTMCGCDESSRPKTMYAVQYTLELKDGPKTIIDIVYVDSSKDMGLFLKKDDSDKEVSHLLLVSSGGQTTKKICSSRSRISSYGIMSWKEEKPEQ